MGGHGEQKARSMWGLHWDDPQSRMPDDLYKTIEPALRLASMFLAYSRQFFMMILRADQVPVKGVNVLRRTGLLENRTWLQCLDPAWLPTPEDERLYDRAMAEIASDFRLYCGEGYKTIYPTNEVYAATTHSIHPRFWIFNFFAHEYFVEFTSSRFRHTSVQQRYRLLFQFAATLLHELAHVMLRKRREDETVFQLTMNIRPDPEPLFEPTDPTAELGHAWESWAFGGTMYPTGYPTDMRTFGLRYCPWLWPLQAENLLCVDFPSSEFIIHAACMTKFFSTAGWERHGHGHGHGHDHDHELQQQALTVELTPLRALHGNVEDKRGDAYARSYWLRLEHVHRGMSSAALRNYQPPVTPPPLPPLEMSVDLDELMGGGGMLKRRRRRGREKGKGHHGRVSGRGLNRVVDLMIA